MKTVKSFAYFMAVAMVSTVGMVSCKDKNAPEEEKGRSQSQQQVESVKTEFTISMPAQLGPNRMPSEKVQVNGMEHFQGLTGITLLPFAKSEDHIAASDVRLGGANITLANLTKAEIASKNNQAKLYNDVNIPLTTSSFLFYAKSAAAGTNFEVGSLKPTPANLNADPSGISFDLEQIMPSATTEYTTGHDALIAYLNAVANASAGSPAVKWCDVPASGTGADAGMAALFETYSTIHGLSSFEVSRVLTDLYRSLKPLRLTNELADAVMDAIDTHTGVTMTGTNNDSVSLSGDLAGFPENCNLPVGSVDIKWVGESTDAFQDGLYSNMAALDKYVYPAQLWYYVNSFIKTSNSSKKTVYDNTTNEWGDVLAAHEGPLSVNSRTRAVAITSPVEYAVGRLDVGVKTAASPLKDNSDQIQAEATDVAVPAAGFPITGILVGGQKQVMFDFTTTTDPSAIEYTIYDKNMSYATMAATTSDMLVAHYNHTLVLETAATTVVRIAVEMVNNTGKDFYGVGNQLIPNGGKFYVVAQLVPPTDPAASATGRKVFKQDYTTTATLTLKNLRNAYNTIPDLRTPKLELGFSVNLEWRTGDTYDVDLGI